MNPRVRSLAAVAIGVALATVHCASSPYATGAHIDTEYDFAAVKRLAFARVPSKPLASPNGKILRSAIEESLMARGFEWVGEDEAQLWISYDVGVFSSTVSWGEQSGLGQGRIVVRAINPKTSREVWYGWAQANLRSTPDPERRIRAAVEALLEDRVRSGS